MKKIIALLMTLVCMFMLTACEPDAVAASVDDFKAALETVDAEAHDQSADLEEGSGMTAAVTAYDEAGWQIVYYEFEKADMAISAFDNLKADITEDFKEIQNVATSGESLNNAANWHLSGNDQYHYLGRVDNTFVYAKAISEYKDTVMTVIDAIGY